MWAISAASVANLEKIPIYEILSVVFLIGFLCSTIYNTYYKNWKKTLRSSSLYMGNWYFRDFLAMKYYS